MTDIAPDPAYHYAVIRRAIDLIDGPGGTALGLDALAGALGMSPAHFQRVFSRWVGVSPKRYQQYLTLGHARALLDARFSTLEASHAAGMSGPGRLHDLFVTWQALTPGEHARRGAGLRIAWSHAATPFGEALAMATPRGLCGLAFCDEIGRDAAFADLAARWPEATLHHDPATVAPLVAAAFAPAGRVPLHVLGAPFQIKVWEALLAIPSGHVTTYGAIAGRIGRPGAARAVGTAVGRNPLGFVIPCHRCLRGSGGLGGYHWGVPVKRAMLGWESARVEAGEVSPK